MVFMVKKTGLEIDRLSKMQDIIKTRKIFTNLDDKLQETIFVGWGFFC
jgi:hypothetical protein